MLRVTKWRLASACPGVRRVLPTCSVSGKLPVSRQKLVVDCRLILVRCCEADPSYLLGLVSRRFRCCHYLRWPWNATPDRQYHRSLWLGGFFRFAVALLVHCPRRNQAGLPIVPIGCYSRRRQCCSSSWF